MKGTETRRLELVEVVRGARELELAFDAACELAADVLRERSGNEVLLYQLLEDAVLAIARDSVRRVAGVTPPTQRSDLANSGVATETPTVPRIQLEQLELGERLEDLRREVAARLLQLEQDVGRIRSTLRGV